MDIVTHGLAGALVARAGGGRASWPLVAAAVGGALAHDLDVLARLWDPMAAITVHRTASHSLIGALPLAAGVAGAIRLCSSAASFWPLAAFAYLGTLSHVGLDLLTPFGTAALWPFATRRLALGWLYVIDPVVIGLVLIGLLGRLRSARHRTWGAQGALTALLVYVIAVGAMSRTAEGQFRRSLGEQGVMPARAIVVPVFPGPLRWLGVAEADDGVYQARFSIGGGGGRAERIVTLPRVTPDPGLDRFSEVRAFRAFARFPWVTVVADGDTQLVEFRDLAFEDHPFGGPMTLRIRLDRSGAVRASELGHKL